LTRDDINEFRARVFVGLHFFRTWFEFRVLALHLAVRHLEIETFEEVR
jgi:hypothetical protein